MIEIIISVNDENDGRPPYRKELKGFNLDLVMERKGGIGNYLSAIPV